MPIVFRLSTVFPAFLDLPCFLYFVNTEIYFLRYFRQLLGILFPLLISKKTGYPISCTGLIKGEIFRSSVISLASVFIPHLYCNDESHKYTTFSCKALLFYANFKQTRRELRNFSNILEGKFHEKQLR